MCNATNFLLDSHFHHLVCVRLQVYFSAGPCLGWLSYTRASPILGHFKNSLNIY